MVDKGCCFAVESVTDQVGIKDVCSLCLAKHSSNFSRVKLSGRVLVSTDKSRVMNCK